MKYSISIILASVFISFIISTSAFADDNIANCEIVVQQPIDENPAGEDGDNKGAQIATFLPAGDFIFSVFDADPDKHLTEVDGKPIRAVMCTRNSVVPSEFDFKMIRTGIPLYLSPDFDAPKSPFLGISKTGNKTGDKYVYDYVGPDLSKDDLELLELRMKVLNNAKD